MYLTKQGLAPHGVHTYDTRPMPEDGLKLCNVAVLAGEARTVPLSVPLINLAIPVLGVATFTHMFHRLAAPRPAAQRSL